MPPVFLPPDVLLTDAAVQSAVDRACALGILKYVDGHHVAHAPFSYFPHLIAAEAMQQMQSLTPAFNQLAASMAADIDFLRAQFSPIAASDPFIAFLLQLLEASLNSQPAQLMLSRSDYFLHADNAPQQPSGHGAQYCLKQVELNTISVSYAGLTGQVVTLHQQLAANGQLCDGLAPTIFPSNPLPLMADGFSRAHQSFGQSNAAVLFITQPQEGNVFDQRLFEYALEEKGIPVLRATLAQLHAEGKLKDGHLWFEQHPISIVYFRAAYNPEDLQSESQQAARKMIVHADAIECPNIGIQLAGMKMMQYALLEPTILQRFLPKAAADAVTKTFARMYQLTDQVKQNNQSTSAMELARNNPFAYVLKPQREGGGHNVYGQALTTHLQTLASKDYPAWLLMERLHPPQAPAWLIREGQLLQQQTVTEIGRFGVWFSDGRAALFNQDAGYLARTKGTEVMEGGVSAGGGHLSSLAYKPF